MKWFTLLLIFLLPLSSFCEDFEIKTKGIDLDAPLKDTKNNEVKKLIKEILEDIEDSIEGSSSSRYKAVRLVEGTVNNFNLKKAGINLQRSFGYYSNEYKGLFLDLMTSKLMTHGIETAAASVATIIQIAAPSLSGWERTALGFVQSLAVPGAIDFLCWAGDACFLSFYSYRKAMRKLRLNLVKVPKKLGVYKLWNRLFEKVDGERLIDRIISGDGSLKNFTVKTKELDTNIYRLINPKTKKIYAELNFKSANKNLILKNIRFYNETLLSVPQKELNEFLALFNSNTKEAVTTAKAYVANGKIEELNKKFHIEKVISHNVQSGSEFKEVFDVQIRNNTVRFSGKWKKKSFHPNYCSDMFKGFTNYIK